MAKSNISKQWGDEPHHARPSYAKDKDLSYKDLSAEANTIIANNINNLSQHGRYTNVNYDSELPIGNRVIGVLRDLTYVEDGARRLDKGKTEVSLADLLVAYFIENLSLEYKDEEGYTVSLAPLEYLLDKVTKESKVDFDIYANLRQLKESVLACMLSAEVIKYDETRQETEEE